MRRTTTLCTRARETACSGHVADGGRCASLGRPALFLLRVCLAAAVALAFDGEDLGVMGQAVDEGDGTAGVGKDAVPMLEGQVRRLDDGLLLVAPADKALLINNISNWRSTPV